MVTLRFMIDTIGQALGIEPKIEVLPNQPGDVSRTCADITVAAEELGYSPQTPFEQGIERFVAWFRNQRAETA